MRLVNHAAGQHRRARAPVHPHPFEQETERFAQLAAATAPLHCREVTAQVSTPQGDDEGLHSDQRKLLPVVIGYVIAILIGLFVPVAAVALALTSVT